MIGLDVTTILLLGTSPPGSGPGPPTPPPPPPPALGPTVPGTPDGDLLDSGAVDGTPTPPPLPTFWRAMEARVSAEVTGLTAWQSGGATRRIALDRAPAGTALPYSEYSRAGSVPSWNTASEATRDGRFTATVYAASDDQADALVAAIVAALRDAPLAFAGGELIYLRPGEPDPAALDPDPGPAGEDVSAASVEFRYMIHS